jgi:poly(A) polymerase
MDAMRDYAVQVIRKLRDEGHQAYLVGGCVRDILLGRNPADYDVATSARPDEVLRTFPKALAVGAQFGVVLVPFGSHKVEVATFRSDGIYSDGRHPDHVQFSQTAEEDVQRRDFTINGLLLDPLDHDRVLDYVGGRADIERKVVRTIGEPHRRFAEDKLRMLRAVRFAGRFKYAIAPDTMGAIQELAPQIHQVSRERIRDEITKMLTEGEARRAFELLDESKLLREILPEVAAMKGVEQPPQFHPEGDVWVHTLMLLEALPSGASPTLAWAALLHDVGKPPTFRRAPDRIRFDNHADVGEKMAREIGNRFRMSNEEISQITAIVAQHMKFPEITKMRESTLKRFLRQPKFDEHLEMHRLDCLASHGDLTLHNLATEKLKNLPEEQIRPKPLITGHDLIKLGYRPGPEFREILTRVEDLQLEGQLVDSRQALDWVRATYPPTTPISK